MISLNEQPQTAFLFPGQGSQYVGMGLDLLEKRDFLMPIFKKAEDVLGFSISNLAFFGPAEELNQTINAQPALLMISMASLEIMRYQSILPDMVAGHSLGEYSALVAAEVLRFEEALVLVRRRGELMEKAYPAGQGGMTAILGLEADKVEEACREAQAIGLVKLANYNCPGQVVISGEKLAVEKAAAIAKAKGAKRVVPLNVSGPFHSPLMSEAAKAFSKELDKFKFHNPKIRFFTNVEGRELQTGKEIKETLIKQLTQCVEWDKEMRQMIKTGARQFYEVGPGTVLCGLIKRIDNSVNIRSMGELNNGISK